MLSKKLMLSAATLALSIGIGGCATPDAAIVTPHNHMRDAKQGTAYPAPAPGASPRKLLHDHREMK